ncbi:NUDIX hydrolase [Candidatus Roizmanbacteria bacterium]|nr:NUDIX hydrolase [Candidatus Roizmanbacteria bacterium]
MLNHYKIILAVGAFIMSSKKQILIVKKSPHEKVDGGLWTVPGGKVYQNEPLFNALKREVKEEVGLTIKKYQWIGEDVFENNKYWFHGQHFLCTVAKSSPVILEKNLLDYRWISRKDVKNFEFHPNIRKRLQEQLLKILSK